MLELAANRVALRDHGLHRVAQPERIGRHAVDALITAEPDEQPSQLGLLDRRPRAGEVERADDELKRIRSRALEMLIAHLLNYAAARFADERDCRGVFRLIVEQLGRELDRVVDRAGVRVERVAKAIFLAPAPAHLEQRLRELLLAATRRA